MPDRPYHHGRLRTVLLGDAERTLREQGVDALSLRDLARQAGVSHAAPHRHFADRQALLDALATSGFARLADELRAAADDAGDDYQARLRAAATAYVSFATRDAALLDLMFAARNARNTGPPAENAGPPATENAALREASERLFTTVGDLIRHGRQTGELPAGDPGRLCLLLLATLQGIAALVTSARVRAEQADALIADAVALFTGHPPERCGQRTRRLLSVLWQGITGPTPRRPGRCPPYSAGFSCCRSPCSPPFRY